MSVSSFQSIPQEYDLDSLRSHYGGKASNLIRMIRLGLPVPSGFMISCDWSKQYESDPEYVERVITQSFPHRMAELENLSGKKFGAATKANVPLFVSVRSGAPISMPGMMDTVLNVGLNDKSVKVLANMTDPDFAWDSYRRFMQSYGVTVLGLPKSAFEEIVKPAEHFCGGSISAKMNQHLINKFKVICGGQFPQNVDEQLWESTKAVFKSWNSERAVAYRQHENISDHQGTGVVIQEMVFGNLNDSSCTGVLFTRNPVTGTGEPYGDFLPKAQGEDVVDGSKNPKPIAALEDFSADVHRQLMSISYKLEADLKDMCDIEFTVEDGKLYILQVRVGKRSAKASRRIPFELLYDNMITVDRAVEMVDSLVSFTETEEAVVSTDLEGYTLIGHGLVACDGDVEGVIALDYQAVKNFNSQGINPILVAMQTDPEDMPSIIGSSAMVTFTGGLVSHAAVVARGWNKPCIVGLQNRLEEGLHLSDLHSSDWNSLLKISGVTYRNGDHIVIRSSENGAVYLKKAE